MKRSPPPKRNYEAWLAWQQRTRENAIAKARRRARSPLRRVGAKGKRERVALDRCRAVVVQRSGGWCEATTLWGKVKPVICGQHFHHPGAQLHHVWPEDRDAGVHDPTRCLWVCGAAHRWIHANPIAAAELRLLRDVRRVQ